MGETKIKANKSSFSFNSPVDYNFPMCGLPGLENKKFERKKIQIFGSFNNFDSISPCDSKILVHSAWRNRIAVMVKESL